LNLIIFAAGKARRSLQAILLFVSLLCFSSPGPSAAAAAEIEVKINDLSFDNIELINVDGRFLAPPDQISSALNLKANWEGEALVMSKDGKRLEFAAGSKGVWSGGKLFCLDVPPQYINGRFYVPLRFLCESSGARVSYNGDMIGIEYPINNDNDITINFAGDTTLAWSFEEAAGDDFNYPFAASPWFAQADITMVNLENAITDRGFKVPKQFNFRMPPKYLQVLQNGGVDIVNLANNHVWDYGQVGVEDTIGYLDEAGIRHIGAGVTEKEAKKPAILEVKGKRIGFLGYFFMEGNVREDVSALKQNADVVIVNFHWGTERSNYPESYQVDLAHRAIDAGADLVIGHHPHVLQGIERYKGGFIVYSLGNFIFGGNSCRQHDTFVFQLIIREGQKLPAIIPVRVSNWRPYWLEGAEGRRVIDLIKEYSRNLENPLL
jgi:hypothetical protein